MRLLICRHATAVDATPSLGDDGRWLTAGGRAEARALGERFKAWGESPGAILTSPLVRAVQTADAVAAGLESGLEVAAVASLGPDGGLSELLDDVVATGAATVLVVGHEPQVSGWAAQLLGLKRLPLGFERCMVVAIDFAAEPAPGAGTLDWVTHPRRPHRFRF